MSVRGLLELCTDGQLLFWCRGCEMHHGVYVSGSGHPVWGFNGDYRAPSFTPSILVHRPIRCHSFVREGWIQYLPDSTHAFAGQTVPLTLEPQETPA